MSLHMHKEMRFLKNILFSNFKRLHSPYKIMLALTYRCNLQCKICNIWRQPQQEELAIQALGALFRSVPSLSWLDITGGEITLRDDIIEVMQEIIKNTKNLLIIHISTNGQFPLRLLMLIQSMVRCRIRLVVNISVDGPREINTDLRGIGGSYRKSIETFMLLKKIKKIHCYLSCTISKYNIHYLDDLLLDLRKDIPRFSFQDLHFNIFHHSSHYYRNNNPGELEGSDYSIIEKYIRSTGTGNVVKSLLERAYARYLADYLSGKRFPLRCQALKSSCFIDPSGGVYPCAMFNRRIGSLQEYGFNLKKIWENSNAESTAETISKRGCPGCWSPCEAYPALLGNMKGVLQGCLKKRKENNS